MTTATRRVLLGSVLVVALGVAVGLAAYLVEFQAGRLSAQSDTPELHLVPGDAAFVGFADLRAMTASRLWQQLRESVPVSPESQGRFEAETGINVERDVDRVVVYLAPPTGDGRPDAGLALARGRFDVSKIEALMQQHGASVEEHRQRRLLVTERPFGMGTADGAGEAIALSFIEPGLAAIGTRELVRRAIDRSVSGPNASGNDEIMNLVRSLEGGDLWAVGRYDALGAGAQLPETLAGQIPPISWLALSARVSSGIGGILQVETRDEASAENLREVVRGFIALGKMQSGSEPGMQSLLESLELRGTGRTVALAFEAPAALLEQLAARPGLESQ